MHCAYVILDLHSSVVSTSFGHTSSQNLTIYNVLSIFPIWYYFIYWIVALHSCASGYYYQNRQSHRDHPKLRSLEVSIEYPKARQSNIQIIKISKKINTQHPVSLSEPNYKIRGYGTRHKRSDIPCDWWSTIQPTWLKGYTVKARIMSA